MNLSVDPPIHPSIDAPMHLPMHVPIDPSAHALADPSINAFMHPMMDAPVHRETDELMSVNTSTKTCVNRSVDKHANHCVHGQRRSELTPCVPQKSFSATVESQVHHMWWPVEAAQHSHSDGHLTCSVALCSTFSTPLVALPILSQPHTPGANGGMVQ